MPGIEIGPGAPFSTAPVALSSKSSLVIAPARHEQVKANEESIVTHVDTRVTSVVLTKDNSSDHVFLRVTAGD